MITVKTIGSLHFMFAKDMDLRQCFTNLAWAKREAKKINEALEHLRRPEAA